MTHETIKTLAELAVYCGRQIYYDLNEPIDEAELAMRRASAARSANVLNWIEVKLSNAKEKLT